MKKKKRKKKKKQKWPQPIVHYPVSPTLSLVWYWMRVENVCNPELDQQMQMTQNNCWVSGERGQGPGEDQRSEALWESNRQVYHLSLNHCKGKNHFLNLSVCLQMFLPLWRLSGLSRSVIVMETRSLLCFQYNKGQEAFDLAVYNVCAGHEVHARTVPRSERAPQHANRADCVPGRRISSVFPNTGAVAGLYLMSRRIRVLERPLTRKTSGGGPCPGKAEASILISCLERMPARLSVDLAGSGAGRMQPHWYLMFSAVPLAFHIQHGREETRLQGKLRIGGGAIRRVSHCWPFSNLTNRNNNSCIS
ncbi:uncharacterized protein isoform X2 [Takifugu rubripes]|uniref:uncharacterized protein isoform X2 n=1 Tax=Takifugu rubripes TaxID=31033 RepID=UPI001145FD83|nr:uncharacterized protein LOC115247345 isoform X2 [Takifugu rubripes]